MASFISALSFFVFVLISGCFTLPIGNNFLSETSTPFGFDATTETSVHERMFSEDATISSIDGMTTEDATREPRMFNEVATEESFTFVPTTERDAREPRVFDESFTFVPTTERSFHEKRGIEDFSSDMTMESTTERDELSLRDVSAEVFTESSSQRLQSDESVLPTTEIYREIQGWSQPSTTVEPRMATSGTHMSFTTEFMPSMSSTIEPEMFTRDPATTRKYTGLLADKLDHEVESDEDEREHKTSHGKEKFVEPKDEEKKVKKVTVVVEDHEEVNGKVKPEIEEEKFEKITMVPKKLKGIREHEKLMTKEDKPKKFTKEEMDLEEHTPELEKVKDVEHKEFISKHDEDEKFHKGHELDMKESHEEIKKLPKPELEKMKKLPKPELEEMHKESHEEMKKLPKPELEEMHKESHEEMKKLHKPELEEAKPLRTGHEFRPELLKKSEEKESSEEKKTSHKQEGELEEEFHPEKFIPKRPTTPRRPQVDSDDNTEYPKALYFDKTWTSVVKIPSDFAILDETTDVVTVLSKVRPSKPVESRDDERKLNQGEESARAE